LAFDSAGNLYAANYSANTIERFTPGGVASVFAAGVNHPVGLAFDSAGNLYAGNYSGHTIQRFTPGGVGSIFATGLTDPSGVAFDGAGNLYVADEWASPGLGRIREFTPDGVGSVFASTGLSAPVYIAIQVPEPSTVALAGLGAAALMIFRRRR
jgi:DNA-binding beta-propeller fold protein YncE